MEGKCKKSASNVGDNNVRSMLNINKVVAF